ncbi:hypothetical protein E2C01_014636 [Portunus trituberculatus]|uniref:Uncharacterized protein n=1 Tax=Portunus trituberculatus TaxID=210409 RepID=A0A5B7DKH2_PORTR|nr:hypothetical protein [Portunus trituberculatus]
MVSGEMKFFLWCRRSGYDKYHSRVMVHGGQRKRSVKINAVCTSFMEVTFDTAGGATVHFCRTHYGHANDGQHLRLNAEERDSIRQLIQEGHGASSIITTMKTQMPQHRHHLLKYGNIRGIYIRQTQGSGLAESDQETFQDAVVNGDQNSLTSPLQQPHSTDMAESDQETFEDAVMNRRQNSLTSPLQQPHSTGVVEGGQVIYQNVVMGIGSQNSLTYSLQQPQCTGIVEGGQVMYQNAVVNEGSQDSLTYSLQQAQGSGMAECGQVTYQNAVVKEGDQDSLTLEVEKEVEVEAIDRQPSDTSEILDLDQLQACSVESLKAEVKAKIERAFHLASSVTNEETLKYVSENLDHLTDLLERSRGIEVVSEASKPLASQDTGQNVVLHKDIDGNTHLLLCSSESIDNLMCKEEDAA